MALVMLPNLAYLLLTPPNDVLAVNSAVFWLWNVLENIGRFGTMIPLCIFAAKSKPAQTAGMTALAICLLLAYDGLWKAYFTGVTGGILLVAMALCPTAFFLLIAWRQQNLPTVAFGVLFTVTHIAITAGSFCAGPI